MGRAAKLASPVADRTEALEELDALYSANLLRQLMEISQAFNRRLRERTAALGHPDLKMSFATVMAHAGFPRTRLSDIAALNGLSKQSVSQTARELVELGYIELIPDPDDSRARIIALSAQGRILIADSLHSIDAVRAEAVELVGAHRFAIFESVAADLWANIGRRAEATPPRARDSASV